MARVSVLTDRLFIRRSDKKNGYKNRRKKPHLLDESFYFRKEFILYRFLL